jgi:hypothetical protein
MQAAVFFFSLFFAMMFTAIAYFAGGWDLAYITLFSYAVARAGLGNLHRAISGVSA